MKIKFYFLCILQLSFFYSAAMFKKEADDIAIKHFRTAYKNYTRNIMPNPLDNEVVSNARKCYKKHINQQYSANFRTRASISGGYLAGGIVLGICGYKMHRESSEPSKLGTAFLFGSIACMGAGLKNMWQTFTIRSAWNKELKGIYGFKCALKGQVMTACSPWEESATSSSSDSSSGSSDSSTSPEDVD